MRPRFLTGFVLIALLCPLGSSTAVADLFASDEPLELSLSGPLSTLIDTMEDREAYPFVLEVEGEKLSVELSARGNSRLKVCDFPPLRLSFTAPPPEDSHFAGQERIKLVTHCRDVDNMAMNLLEEFAAYRIFNALTPIGYRVRLLEIRYTDDDERHSGTHRAFAIEPTEQLAQRLEGEELELPGVYLSRFDPDHLALVFTFQYLIGNTDWSLVAASGDEACCHNGKVIGVGDVNYLIPYDYDRSGLVNASYAKPARKARIRRVIQRRYMGYCGDNEAALRAAIDRTIDARPEIEGSIQALPGLHEKDRVADLRFIDKYYERAQEEQALLTEFQATCID